MICLQAMLGRYSEMPFVSKDILSEMKELSSDFCVCVHAYVLFGMSPPAGFVESFKETIRDVRLKCHDPGNEVSPEKGSFYLLFK